MTPVQCKMARVGLGWGVRDLAQKAQVSTQTVTRFEKGEELRPITLATIRKALELGGVEFISENGGGPGVRMKK
jgi:DNA-binding XRE family transcriptional regulator